MNIVAICKRPAIIGTHAKYVLTGEGAPPWMVDQDRVVWKIPCALARELGWTMYAALGCVVRTILYGTRAGSGEGKCRLIFPWAPRAWRRASSARSHYIPPASVHSATRRRV